MQLAGPAGQFNKRQDRLVYDDIVLIGHKPFTEIPDPSQTWWDLYLDALGRGQIDRVVSMEAESKSVGDVVAVETVVEQSACDVQEIGVLPT